MPDLPYRNFRFLVEFDGLVQAGFSECSGFGSNLEVIEYREGGDPANVRKFPGMASYPDITLKNGVSNSHDLYDWHVEVLDGEITRRQGSIILLDELGQEAVRWNFFQGWPSKWEGPALNATGKEVAIQSLTISVERLVKA
ncbi:MAG: phage tail protein [Planctomycetaceae bacterium]|nr:phage tail protein [Planctomycetaceae bacterium]